MRIVIPGGVRPLEPLSFRGSRGEQFTINVLDHDLIRVRHHPDGAARLDRTWLVVGSDGETPREGRSRDDLSPFPQPAYELKRTADQWTLQTEKLRLEIHLGDFHLEWYDRVGQRFAADLRRRAYAYDQQSGAVYHYLERRADELYYGFGERSGRLDKHGRRFRMVNVDALGYDAENGDPLYKHIPFYITWLPEQQIAYGLFYDNLATSVFDMGSEIDAFWGFYRYYQAEAGDLDYYLLYGPSIPAVVERFVRLTGRPALPPRWSLGYLGSTMSYTEAPDAQEQLKQFVHHCQQHDIPCDMFHLSSGYSTNESGRRYVFTWNRSRVPDPPAMTDHFHQAGIQVGANIKPYLLKDHPQYETLRAQGGFIQSPEGDQPMPSQFWSGGAFETGDGAYVDFTSEAGYRWWQAQATAALLEMGIDALWNDNNEFEIWDDQARCDGFGQPIPMALARPLQTLLMGRASYEALQTFAPDQRPFVLTRSGCPGIQRYAQTWSGDNSTSWHSLRYNLPMGLGMSLSGIANTGHDVGGFFGPAPDPELFVRWVQCGVFHPRFTIHSWNTDGTVNEPWMHPEVLPIVRQWMQFRYRLLPLLHRLLWQSHRTGQPIIRPLVYAYPADPRCWRESFQFMLGESLLVAPVVEPGARTWPVYLPAGSEWCDFYSGQWYSGGRSVVVDAPLDRIPLLVASGGLIPLGKVMAHVGAQPDDVREVYAYPRQGHSQLTLIDDDGRTLGYQRGEYSELVLEMTADEAIHFSLTTRHAGYPLPYKTLDILLPVGESRPVSGGVEAGTRDRRRLVQIAVS